MVTKARPQVGVLSRRVFLGGMGAFCLSDGAHAAGAGNQRIVALDWVSAQNLLALGLTPLGFPELQRYAQSVVEPAVPHGVTEIGLRTEPNLELVEALRPDLIVAGNDLAPMARQFERIAPLMRFDPDRFDEPDRIANGKAAMKELADHLGAGSAFEAFVATFDQEIAAARTRLQDYDARPLFIATVLDGRRMLVFGKNSLFQSVMADLGIENAWDGFTSRYGHATVSMDRLTTRPEARLLAVGAQGLVTVESVLAAPVLSSLPFVRQRRFSLIAQVLFYGGLPSALRFARLASAALGEDERA